MSVDRPIIYPQWASDDVVDPTSGQNNVVTPPSEKMTNGWDLKEFPPRQWFNWLARYTYQWILWLDQQQQATQVGIDSGSGFQAFPNVTVGGLAQISIVDQGNSANSYQGMAYFPPASVSPVTLIKTGGANLVPSTISITGVVSVASGGSGPYLIVGTMLNV